MFYGLKQIDVSLKDIVSVVGKTGILMGEITISTSGQNYKIKNVMKDSVIPFTNIVNSTRNNKRDHSSNEKDHSDSNDIVSKLERLAALKDKGILTDEEFQQQKNKLLNT